MQRVPGRFLFVFATACGVAACAPTYQLTLSTTSATEPLRPRPPGCEFRVLAFPPQGPYEEIGTLTPHLQGALDPESFKRSVDAAVCQIGGDVVVTEMNGSGVYVRGTVMRKMGPPPGPAANVPPGAAGLIKP